MQGLIPLLDDPSRAIGYVSQLPNLDALFDERLDLRQNILHFVASKGSVPILNMLAQYPGFRRTLNSRDQYGRTPLATALGKGHAEFALALLQLGADASLRSGNGTSALHLFAKIPWDPVGDTALHVAAVAGNDNCAQAIIQAGGNLDVPSSDNSDTPLIYAVRARKPSIVAMLVRAGANLNHSGTGGTALEIAHKMGQDVTILSLLQKPAAMPAKQPAPVANGNHPVVAKTAPTPVVHPSVAQGINSAVLVTQPNGQTFQGVIEQVDHNSGQYLVAYPNQVRNWQPRAKVRPLPEEPGPKNPNPPPVVAAKQPVMIPPRASAAPMPAQNNYAQLPPVIGQGAATQTATAPAAAAPAPGPGKASPIVPAKNAKKAHIAPQPVSQPTAGPVEKIPAVAFGNNQIVIPRSKEEDNLKASGIYRNPTAALSAFLGDSANSYTVQVLLPYGQTILMNAHQKDSYAQIQRNVFERLVSIGLNVDRYAVICDPKLPSERLTSNTPFFAICQEFCLIPKVLIVPKEAQASRESKVLAVEIGALIGHALAFGYEDLEITTFRERATRLRWEFKNSEASTQRIHFHPPGGKVFMAIHLPGAAAKVKTVAYNYPTSADDFKADLIAKEPTLKGVSPADLRLKVVGKSEYLEGSDPLSHFEFIRDTVSRGDKITLALVEANAESGAVPERFDPDEEAFLGIEDTGPVYSHEKIVSTAVEWDLMASISLWEMNRPYRLRISGIDNITMFSILGKEYPANEDDFIKAGWQGKFNKDKAGLFQNCMKAAIKDVLNLTLADFNLVITAGVYLGGEQLSENLARKTEFRLGTENPRWDQWLDFDILMCNLPREAVVSVSVEAVLRGPLTNAPESFPIGWANFLVFDYKNELNTGEKALHMWPGPGNPIGTCVPNTERHTPILFMETETFALPIVFPTERLSTGTTDAPSFPSKQIVNQIQSIIKTDPLHQLNSEEKALMWQFKEHCSVDPKALPKVLLSVPYNDYRAVGKLHSLIDEWAEVAPLDALELLGSRFGDQYVRTYAANLIDKLPDPTLNGILLQLVQGLKYEPYHDSALARMLLRRALANRKIGHYFFWYLKSELHNASVSVRYELLLEAYLRGLDSFRNELRTQNLLQESFVNAARLVQTTKDRDLREAWLQAEIAKIKLPEKLSIPLSPTMEASGIMADKCRCMVSKKVPLWLTFANSDVVAPGPIRVIFKAGDDLNQDMLTLQVIRLMDKEWQAAGLDLQMSPYGCVATGDQIGFIEVVENAETLAKIQGTTSKGKTSMKGVFKKETTLNWLKSQKGNDNARNLEACIDRFVKSCAAYCVATYILGIGDRHNDNVMMTRDGKLFHIDFGHFLGNIKKKLGMKREKAPFVFTPDMAHLMGGEGSPKFKEFEKLCCDAYIVIRRSAAQIMNLFAMMLNTGIPELREIQDLYYFRTSFSLELDEAAARQKMIGLIQQSLNCKTTLLMFAIHITANK